MYYHNKIIKKKCKKSVKTEDWYLFYSPSYHFAVHM